MIWTTHNCFSRLAAGHRVRYALLLLCLLCCMVFGQDKLVSNLVCDTYFSSEHTYDVIDLGRFDYIKSGSFLNFLFLDNIHFSDFEFSGGNGWSYAGLYFYIKSGNLVLAEFPEFYLYNVQDGEVLSSNSHISNYTYTFDDDYNDVVLSVRFQSRFGNISGFRAVMNVPVVSSSASFMPSYSPVLDMADEQYYDDLTSNFVSIGAVLLAVPLAIFFIYKGYSFIRGGFMAFLFLSSMLAFARGDTNPNPVSPGYIENTDGSTAFYADYVTNQQFADFAGVQTTETYDFNSPYSDVQLDNLNSQEISNLQGDFVSAADAREAELQLDHMQQDFYDNRYKGYYNSTPIMLWPAALSASTGGVSTDTIFSAPPVWEIFSTFDNNSFGYFSVQSAFNLACNCLGFFIAIGVTVFLVRSLTSK